jgi:hypothetical protein
MLKEREGTGQALPMHGTMARKPRKSTMTDLSRLADLAEIIGAIIVVGGVAFAVLQMRQTRQQRRELAAIELFRSFGSPAFCDAYRATLKLPEGVDAETMRTQYPESENAAMFISTTMENIGVMVFHRIVPSVVVNDLVGTSTGLLFRRLSPWINSLRDELGNPGMFEWFEWLALVLDDFDPGDGSPAFLAHRGWKPGRGGRLI